MKSIHVDILIAMDEELYLPVMTCLDNKVRQSAQDAPLHGVWVAAKQSVLDNVTNRINRTTRLNMEAINNAVREQMQRP